VLVATECKVCNKYFGIPTVLPVRLQEIQQVAFFQSRNRN